MNFKEEIKHKTEEIEIIIERYLPKEEGFQKTILEACNYSVKSGGKRIRPMLMQETYRLFSGKKENEEKENSAETINCSVEPFMAAIEFIHSSSLVHDDLPCMDNDDYRRGKLTTWKAFGEDMGVLAGDGLMIYAFEVAAQAFACSNRSDLVGKAIGILAGKTGIFGMIGGQTVDVELTGKDMDEKQLSFIYRLKTGALIEAAMTIGAVLAGASEEEIEQTEKIAGAVGMAFQIQDDILDLTSTTEQLGKPVNSDEKNNKTTYVTLNGLEQSKKDVEKISEQAVEMLKKLSGNNEFLNELIQMLITREK